MNRMSLKDRAQILSLLVEGNSLRSVTRITGKSINTVSKLLVDAGTACDLYQNETLRKLKCKRLQLDEIWSFRYMKRNNVAPCKEGILGFGDVYTWTAICADTKLVPSWLVGQRNAFYAENFASDLAGRLSVRPQITTDGLKLYLTPIEDTSGAMVDYAMLVKTYGTPGQTNEEHRHYSPAECTGAHNMRITGKPNMKDVSTSYVEGQNPTTRMSMRRFTRLTNGFGKKVENHACAVALHFMHYNFGRIHKTLRVTPAMEAGISDHVWTLEEISRLAD